jgi:hypothetical protein
MLIDFSPLFVAGEYCKKSSARYHSVHAGYKRRVAMLSRGTPVVINNTVAHPQSGGIFA